MPYIAGVLIDIITDVKPNETSSTTDHALEDLSQISDHVINNPTTISLSGVIYDDSDVKVEALRKARENGTIFNFDYMNMRFLYVLFPASIYSYIAELYCSFVEHQCKFGRGSCQNLGIFILRIGSG